MVNLWDYSDADKIRIIDADNDVFEGEIIDITEAGERSELEAEEDCITINCNGTHIQFENKEVIFIERLL